MIKLEKVRGARWAGWKPEVGGVVLDIQVRVASWMCKCGTEGPVPKKPQAEKTEPMFSVQVVFKAMGLARITWA